MYFRAGTLDDLLSRVFPVILKSKTRLTASKGANSEIAGVSLELTQPRARLSRTESKGTIYSCIGEFLWYTAKSKDAAHMSYYLRRYTDYAEPDGTIWGAYGPRMFGGSPSQYNNIVRILREKPTSRQAVIQLFDKNDIISSHKDIPCTCTLQFLARDGILDLITHMRSNDAYLGLPHDIFSFTMLQEMLASHLGLKVGRYRHLVGSLHIYDDFRPKVEQYLGEGLQSTAAMPPMPQGDQWKDIQGLMKVESTLRESGAAGVDSAMKMAESLRPYWADLARLLGVFALTRGSKVRTDRLRKVVQLQEEMSSLYYKTYIRRRQKSITINTDQLSLLGTSRVNGDGL